MSHVLATAAEVIGGVALIATGIGAAASAGLFGTIAAGSSTASTLATIATVAKVAAFAAAVAGIGAELLAPKPPVSPMAWSANPQAPMTYAMGRCYVGGDIVGRWVYGDNDEYQQLVTSYSGAGPHQSIDQLYVDGVAQSTNGDGAVNINDHNSMWARTQLGHTPEASYLTVGPEVSPEWTPDCKLSGHAASIVVLKYDAKGSTTLTTTPQVGYVGHWAKCYDPRKDSTYPGGSGAHRSDDETTWEWTANPFLHALTWLIGRRQNGTLVLGVGMPVAGIIFDQYVEGANIADANGWTLGGTVKSSDDKWDVLKQILQTGSAQPMRLGAQVGCIVNTPRVSLATIEIGDIVGDWSVQATQARRDRFNSVVPRYVAETSVTTLDSKLNPITEVNWAMAPAAPIVVADYVTADGKKRQKGIDYPLVTGPTNADGTAPQQVAQLARYDIENAREFGPITLPLKLRWMGYKPGDVVTGGDSLGELGLVGQDILLLNRALSPANGTVTMTARSETTAKHAFALGQTTLAPPTPSVASEPTYTNPYTQNRAAYQIVSQSVDYPLTSTDDTITIAAFTAVLDDGSTFDFAAGSLTGLNPSTYYGVFATVDGTYLASVSPAADAMAASDNVFIGWQETAASDGSYSGGSAPPPGYGGGGSTGSCPEESTPILLANADLNGPGEEISAADVYTRFLAEQSPWVWSQHETTGAWGAWPVIACRRVHADLFRAEPAQMPQALPTIPVRVFRATADHPIGGAPWQMFGDIGRPDGNGWVIAMTIEEAHTFVAAGVLSHNKLLNPGP